jgi:tetratricopeptide (TPR) repeat protein
VWQSRRGRWAAGIVGLLVVASTATWLTLRPFAPSPGEVLPAERSDPTEVRLRQEAARATADPRPSRELGDHYLASGKSFSALWAYQEALARAPEDVDARHGLARAAASAGQLDFSAKVLAALLKDAQLPAASRRDVARSLAVVYLRSMQPDRAIAALTPLRTQFPELDRELARAYRIAGPFPAAEAAYRRLRREDPFGRDALLGSAQLYLEWNRPEAAIGVLTEAGRRGPLDGETWLWLGRAYARRKDGLIQAATCVSRALDLLPQDASVYYEAGLLLERKGDRLAAVDRFNQAIRLDGKLAEAHLALARTLRALGLTQRARREMAEYYTLRNQPDRVIDALLADKAPPIADADLAERTVLAYTQMQQPKRAAQVSDAAIREHPDSMALLYQGMLIQLQAGSVQTLETMCRQMERKFPQSGDPEWFRGRVAVVNASTADAIQHFQAAVAREPKHASFHAALGRAYAAIPTAENLRRAIPELQKAVSLRPNDASTRQELGELLARAGDAAQAEEQLLRALDLNPSLVAAMNGLLQLCGALKRPAHAALLGELARSLEARQREVQRLRRLCRDHPNDRAARMALARALGRVGRPLDARDHWERAAEGNAPAEARAGLAAAERLAQVLRG